MRQLVNARDGRIWHIADSSTFRGRLAEEGGYLSGASLYGEDLSSEDESLEAFFRDEDDQGAQVGVACSQSNGRQKEDFLELEHALEAPKVSAEGGRSIIVGRSKQSSDVPVKRKRGRPRKERPQENAPLIHPQESSRRDKYSVMKLRLGLVHCTGDKSGFFFEEDPANPSQVAQQGLGEEANRLKSRGMRPEKQNKLRHGKNKKGVEAIAGRRTVDKDACTGNEELKKEKTFTNKLNEGGTINKCTKISEKAGSIAGSKYSTGIRTGKEDHELEKKQGDQTIVRGFIMDKRSKVIMKGADQIFHPNTKVMLTTRERVALASNKAGEDRVVMTEWMSSDGVQEMQRKADILQKRKEDFYLGASDDSNGIPGVNSAESTKYGMLDALEHGNSSRGRSVHSETVRSCLEVINRETNLDIMEEHPVAQGGITEDSNAGANFLQVKELYGSLGSVQSIAGGKDVDNGVVAEEVSSCVTEGGDGNKGHSPCEKREDSDDAGLGPSQVAWALCDDCHKWRCIPAELADVIEDTNCQWSCADNPNKNFADCSIPQEKSNTEINAQLNISEVSFCEEGDDNNSPVDSGDHQQAVWTLIKHNVYLHRRQKVQTIDEVMVCQCKPSNEGHSGCGDECLNRMLSIECVADTCPCGKLCSNQQFQKRMYAKVGWYRCGRKGFGLQVLEDVCKGSFVIEYVGEVLDRATYEARQKEYACRGQKHFYFMTLNSDEVIDASVKGNSGRFINHSCEPNCTTEKWMVNGEVCIGLFALRDLAKGEEITFDYNFVRICGAAAKKCHCGSSVCRGFIGGDPTTPLVVIESESDGEDPEPIMIEEAEEQVETLVDDRRITDEKKQGEKRNSQHEPAEKQKWSGTDAPEKTSNRIKMGSLKKSVTIKKLSIDTNGGRFEGVEDKLNELLDENGGIGRRKDAGMHYLKLLLMTAAYGDTINGEASRRTRDLSMVLDALLKTLHRSVLADIINKNGFQILHNMLKQNRRNYKRTPIIRKLLKVLEFLAAKNILTFEHINARPLRSGIESIRDTIVLLSRHNDGEVQQIARRFRDKWLPRELYIGHANNYARHMSENLEFFSRHQYHCNKSFPQAFMVQNEVNRGRQDEIIAKHDASQKYQHQPAHANEYTSMALEHGAIEKQADIITDQNLFQGYQYRSFQSHPYTHLVVDNQNMERQGENCAEQNASLRYQTRSDQSYPHAHLVVDARNMEKKERQCENCAEQNTSVKYQYMSDQSYPHSHLVADHRNTEKKGMVIADENTFSSADMDAANLKRRRKSRWDENYKSVENERKLTHVFSESNINNLSSTSAGETNHRKSSDGWEHHGPIGNHLCDVQKKNSTLSFNLECGGHLLVPKSSYRQPSIQQKSDAGFNSQPVLPGSETPAAATGVPTEHFLGVAPARALSQQTSVRYEKAVDTIKQFNRSPILGSSSPACSLQPSCNIDSLQRLASNRIPANEQQKLSIECVPVQTKVPLFGVPHAQFLHQMQCIFGASFHPMHIPILMAPHSWGPYLSIDLEPFHEETEEPEPPVPGLSPPHDSNTHTQTKKNLDRNEASYQLREPLSSGLLKCDGLRGEALNLRSTKWDDSLGQPMNTLNLELSKPKLSAGNSADVRASRLDGASGQNGAADWQSYNGPCQWRFHGRSHNNTHRRDHNFSRKHNRSMQPWRGGLNKFRSNNFHRQKNISNNNFQKSFSSSSRGRHRDAVQFSGRYINGPPSDRSLYSDAKERHADSLSSRYGGFCPVNKACRDMSGQMSYDGCSIKNDILQRNVVHQIEPNLEQKKDMSDQFSMAVTGDAHDSACQSNSRYCDKTVVNTCMEEVQATQEMISPPSGKVLHMNEAQKPPFNPHSNRIYDEHGFGEAQLLVKDGAVSLGNPHKEQSQQTQECNLASYNNSVTQERDPYDTSGNSAHTNAVQCLGRSLVPLTDFKKQNRKVIEKDCQSALNADEFQSDLNYQDGLGQLAANSLPQNYCEEWVGSSSFPDTVAHYLNLSYGQVMDAVPRELNIVNGSMCSFEINDYDIPCSSHSKIDVVPQDDVDAIVNASCNPARWINKKGDTNDLGSIEHDLYRDASYKDGGMETAEACLGELSRNPQGPGYMVHDSWRVCHDDFGREEMDNFLVSDEEGLQHE